MQTDNGHQPHKREELVELAGDEDLLFLDGFDDCILGICNAASGNPLVVYDEELILRALQKRNEMKEEEAVKYYHFNLEGAFLGPRTPVIVTRP